MASADAAAVETAEAAKNQRPGLVKAVARPLVLAAKITSATSTTSSIDQLDSARNQAGIRASARVSAIGGDVQQAKLQARKNHRKQRDNDGESASPSVP